MLATLVVFVAAERREFSGLLRRARDVRRLSSPLSFAAAGSLNGAPVLMVANGPGPALAGEAARWAMAEREQVALVSTGYCGALQRDVSIGDIIVASCVHAPDSGDVYAASAPVCDRAHHSGVVVSVDRVIGTPEEKRRLGRDGALAVEMEAAAVAQAARETGASFHCVRAVTDGVDEGFEFDLNAARGADGRFRTARIVSDALLRPWRGVPQLMRLLRSSGRASEALGDFFGQCQF
ncbi:MAG: hypothetical protein SFV54_16800 [Bryobacteraceae bacterium]|nr:hypothetical protein [Bryobacteraceae bacterium]